MKIKLILLCHLFLFGFMFAKASPFITKWDLSIPGSGPTQLSFGVGTSGTASYTWETIPAGQTGSGTFTESMLTVSGLPAGAMIRLSIDSANFNRVNMDVAWNDQDRLVDVEQWGSVKWISMEYALSDCENLNISATDIPDLSNVQSMAFMFMNCDWLNGPSNINSWNTSNITNMRMMFNSAKKFNQPIGNWIVSNVTDMSYMFAGATNFNQPIGNWITSKVTNMKYMFTWATNFNQPIGNWNISNVTDLSNMFFMTGSFNQQINSWNTSNVTNMSNMFCVATSFNQQLNSWNTSNVTNMSNMFNAATNFNQSLSSWNLQSDTSLTGMLENCGMDCANYSNTLNAWSSNSNTPNSLKLGAFKRLYDSIVIAARNYLISNKGWTISGDSLSNSNCGIVYNYVFLTKNICFGDTFSGHSNSGVYADTLVNSSGFDTIRTFYLTVNPFLNPLIVQNRFKLNATNVPTATSYIWYYNSTPYGGKDDSITISQDGIYIVAVKDLNNCVGYDTLAVICLDKLLLIKVYPNPSSEIFTIDIPFEVSHNVELQVTDLVGRIIYKKQLQHVNQSQVEIDFSRLGVQEGLYMLQVNAPNTRFSPVKLIYRED